MLQAVIYFLICLAATTAGGISGVGGGVIIKPVMDAVSGLGAATISFLSGCTVLAMTITSMVRSRGGSVKVEKRRGTFLAIGAAFGGIMGKEAFELVRAAWERGCRFDAWTSEFDFCAWNEAARSCGLDLEEVACEQFPLTAALPWAHTSPGVSMGHLQREWRRAVEGVTTPDCTRESCTGCGVCPALGVHNVIQGVRS